LKKEFSDGMPNKKCPLQNPKKRFWRWWKPRLIKWDSPTGSFLQVKYLIPMVLTIGITACQANPDREVVVGKNNEDFQNAIVQTDDEPKSSSAVHYQDSYLGSDGKVSFE